MVAQQVTPSEVERELRRLAREVEAKRAELIELGTAKGEAERSWKLAKAQTMLTSDQSSAQGREADAIATHPDLHGAYLAASAVYDAAVESGRLLRAQLEAVRSVGAMVRTEYGEAERIGS